jgi:hypothetical protein
MKNRFYRVVRDLHLYAGLFVSPYVVVFAASVFFLVHAWLPPPSGKRTEARVASNLSLPPNLEQLSGRARIDALRPVLEAAQVAGEVGWIQYLPGERRMIVPVSVPGRNTTVSIDIGERRATVEDKVTGLADAVVLLHKSPGPHLVGLRMNWIYMRIWRWLADGTVYLLLFITVSGVYLWWALRPARKAGLGLLSAGAISFIGLLYALIR